MIWVAKVPTQSFSVRNQPSPAVFVSGAGGTPAAFGAVEGQAAARGGEDLMGLGEQLVKHGIFMQERQNEAQAKELLIKGEELAGELKAKSLRGNLLKEAGNSEVARQFDQNFSRRMSFDLNASAGYVAVQNKKYNSDMNQALVTQS